MYKVIAFYKYLKMKKPKSFAKEHLAYCQSLGARARVLVGDEGINGVVCGTAKQINAYARNLRKNPDFKDIEFKKTDSDFLVFRNTWVRYRKEIVALGVKGVSPKRGGKYLTPGQFKKLLDKKEDVVLVDARNDYEWRVGKFRNAVTLPMETFRDAPKAVKKLKNLKNRKIVTYCTGGIRCEKFSALLKKEGFKDVSQIKGGIHAYVDKYPDTYWEGKLFVFDDRLAIDVNKKNTKPITNCDICKESGDLVLDCSNLKCHEMFVTCESCKAEFEGKCSKCIPIPVKH